MRSFIYKGRRMSDDDGVSNVVSLIMIGGIVISLLGMVFSTYLPAWGKDIEVQTMNGAMDSFMDLKSGMDTLAVGGDPGTSLTTKVTLGSSGGPMFGFGRSTGSFGLIADEGIVQVKSGNNIYSQGRGVLNYESSTTYIDDQSITLEAGAIIREQAGASILKGQPNIILRSSPTELSIYMLVSTLEGTDKTISGTSVYMVTTALMSEDVTSWEIDADQDVQVLIATKNAVVWEGLFRDLMDAQSYDEDTDGAGSLDTGDYTITTGVPDAFGNVPVTLDITKDIQKDMLIRTAVFSVTFN